MFIDWYTLFIACIINANVFKGIGMHHFNFYYALFPQNTRVSNDKKPKFETLIAWERLDDYYQINLVMIRISYTRLLHYRYSGMIKMSVV